MSLFSDYLDSLSKNTASAIALKIVELQNTDITNIDIQKRITNELRGLPLEFLTQLTHAASLMAEARENNEQD
jgi:hypothetical protein